MKIAVLTDGIYPFVIGGIQRHSLNLIKHLVELNIEVIAFHTIPGKTLLSEQESQFFKGIEKVDWQFIPFPKTNSFPGHYLRESYLYSCTIYDKLRSIPDIDLIYA